MVEWSKEGTRSEKREALLEAAAGLLREEGIGGVSLRRVADRAGVSTQMIYTLYGGKSGLLQALWKKGFDELAGALEAVEAEPMEQLRELGRSYRDWALEHPALYEAMFARSLKEFRPGGADVERETRSFQILLECVERCVEEGYFGDLSPRRVADALWTAVHGSVELELSGFYEDEGEAETQFELMLATVGQGLLKVGGGDAGESL